MKMNHFYREIACLKWKPEKIYFTGRYKKLRDGFVHYQ